MMSTKMLVCLMLLLGFTPAVAADGKTSSHPLSEGDTPFDQACFGAIYQVQGYYGDQSGKPMPGLARALVRRCNGNPNRTLCEVASQTMMREYGKTPFSCGSKAEGPDDFILLPDTR